MWYKYLLNNKKKSIVLILIIVLGIFLMSETNIIINSINNNVYKAWAKPFSDFYVVEPINNDSKITRNDNCYDVYLDKIFISGITGRISTYAFFVDEKLCKHIFESNNASMIEGKFPDKKTNQIAISREIASNKNLKLGDFIGKEINTDDGLNGKYEVVGIFDADGVFTIGDFEYYKSNNDTAKISLLTNNDNIIYDKKDIGTSINVYSYENEKEDIIKYGQILKISMIILSAFIYIVVIFIVIFVLYIYYSQRKSEYGILLAIGYRQNKIVGIATKEICIINLLALLSGIIVSIITAVILNNVYFKDIGQDLSVVNIEYFYVSIIMCFLIVILAVIMVKKMISKIDCIALIEGE